MDDLRRSEGPRMRFWLCAREMASACEIDAQAPPQRQQLSDRWHGHLSPRRRSRDHSTPDAGAPDGGVDAAARGRASRPSRISKPSPPSCWRLPARCRGGAYRRPRRRRPRPRQPAARSPGADRAAPRRALGGRSLRLRRTDDRAWARLQRIMHDLSRRHGGETGGHRDGHSILLSPCPGETHMFGLSMIEQFFRDAGWDVTSTALAPVVEILSQARTAWFDVIGLSLGCEVPSADSGQDSARTAAGLVQPGVRHPRRRPDLRRESRPYRARRRRCDRGRCPPRRSPAARVHA